MSKKTQSNAGKEPDSPMLQAPENRPLSARENAADNGMVIGAVNSGETPEPAENGSVKSNMKK